jgi:hypothetical protein
MCDLFSGIETQLLIFREALLAKDDNNIKRHRPKWYDVRSSTCSQKNEEAFMQVAALTD